MKRSKKISVLRVRFRNRHICRCFYEYDKAIGITISMISTTNLYSDRKKNDFELNGYMIRKIDELQKAEIKNDVCEDKQTERGCRANQGSPN